VSEYPSNEIGSLPGVSSFGGGFSYAAWTPGTSVTLCNVPWNNDYRDIVRYASKTALNTYLDGASRAGPHITLDKLTYCRVGVPIRVNIPFGSCYKYNYLRVVNNAQPVTGHGNVNVADTAQTLYYFILDVKYLAPNTTEIYVQLDVWQTFGHDVTFGNCYIERGHIGIANTKNFDNNGRDYLTIPEGLDVGNEYVISQTYEHIFVDNHNADQDMAVMVMSTTSLYGPYGTVDAPKLTMAQGSSYGGVPNGCDLYVFDSRSDFNAFMKYMADKPWVTQGIVSVTAINYASTMSGLDYPSEYEALSWVEGGPIFNRLIKGVGHGDIVNVEIPEYGAGTIPRDRKWLAQDWRTGLINGRYAILKKFLTYPYCAIELTTYSATPIILKPECMYGDDIIVIQKAFMGQPNPRVVFIPYKYNANNGLMYGTDNAGAIINDGGEMFDFMTGIFDLPTFSVVNNGYLSYMAANKNSIAYQHTTADWSQQRALGGAGVGASNTARDIALGRNLADMQTQAIVGNANLARTVAGQRALLGGANAVAGAVTGANAIAGTSAVAAVSGIANQAADYAITTGQIDTSSAIAASLNQGGAAARQNTGIQNNDTNYKYAQFSAQGDYQNAIAGINAKVQDAKLIQPTTAGQMGGDVFNLVMFKWGVFAKVKTLQPAIMSMIGEYWLRYGYAVNRFGKMPTDFMAMQKFTYWKLRETYLASGACPETFRQTIRGIFEKGVTVWANADDIGMIDIADNPIKTGITL
jgi:hypothetical protein